MHLAFSNNDTKIELHVTTKMMEMLLTAGRAKKEMANTEKQEATILPIHVWGTVSPYPIVVTVIWNITGKKASQNTSR